MSATTFTSGMRVRLKEPDPGGARYFTLLHKRWSGWYAHTALPDAGYQPLAHDAVIPESHMEPVPGSWMRYGIPPVKRWLKLLASLPLGLLVFHANRRYRRESFYQLKNRVLKAYGRPDGCDLQVLPPKPCWSCDATGKEMTWSKRGKRVPYADGRMCYDCHGTGEHKPTLYVRLERRKLAWWSFHTPTGQTHNYDQAVALWMPRTEIHGLIRPNPGAVWKGYWSRVALEMLFDFQGFAPHFVRVTAQRWRWRLQWWSRPMRHRLGWVLESDNDDLPF